MYLLELFKKYLFSQQNSPSLLTVKNYLADIRKFITWFQNTYNREFKASEISYETIQQFKATHASETAARSLERYISSLRKFFHFLKIEGITSHDPFSDTPKDFIENEDPFRLKEFKNFLYVYNASSLTIKNYIIDVKQFFTWAKEVAKNEQTNEASDAQIASSISNTLLETYRDRLYSQRIFSPSSINRKLSSLRKYISWANQQGFISNSSAILSHKKQTQSTMLPQSSIEAILSKETPLVIAEKVHEAKEQAIPSYSQIPPVRVIQKALSGLDFLIENIIVTPLVSLINLASNRIWIIQGKPIFDRKTSRFFKKTSNPVANISKELYAPESISTKNFTWYQKLWFHLRFTRPEWYRRYHSYAIARYFNLAVLIIFSTIIGFGIYSALIGSKNAKSPVLAASPTAPLRILSFQGRLTDSSSNPITAATNMRFVIYNDPTASAGARLWEETDKISPDTDGIFSLLLGSNGTGSNGPSCNGGNPPTTPAQGPCNIPQSLFAQNNALYLGVTVENTAELTPRQQIATVAYATNAEVLQGLPPTTDSSVTSNANTVLALNASGVVSIAGSTNTTTVFQATASNVKLTGQTTILATNPGSGGDIQLNPDGLGKIDVFRPLQNTSFTGNIATALGAVEIDSIASILATSSGQSAFTINQNGTGPLISASTSGAAKFTIDNSGNESLAGTITSNSYTTAGGVFYGTSTGLLSLSPAGTTGQCFTSGGSGVPAWGACGSNYWIVGNGTIYPLNQTLDFLVGATATGTSSAKFAVINVNSGTPIATLSAGITGGAWLSASGTLAATTKQSLTLGDNNTGNIQFYGPSNTFTSSGNLTLAGTITSPSYNTAGGIFYGTSTGLESLSVAGGLAQCLISGAAGAPTWATCSTGNAGINWWTTSNGTIYPINQTFDFLVGATATGTSSAKFAVINVNSGTPIATLSAGITGGAWLSASGTLAATTKQSLTLGDNNTGNIQFYNTANTLTSVGNLTLAGSITLPNNNSLTGVTNYIQLSNGISVGGATTYHIDSSGNAVLNNIQASNIFLPATGGTAGFWQLASNVIAPANLANDLAVGGNSTASATFQAFGNNLSGPTVIVTANTSYAGLVAINKIGDILTASSAAATRFIISNQGVVTAGPATVTDDGNGAGGANGVANLVASSTTAGKYPKLILNGTATGGSGIEFYSAGTTQADISYVNGSTEMDISNRKTGPITFQYWTGSQMQEIYRTTNNGEIVVGATSTNVATTGLDIEKNSLGNSAFVVDQKGLGDIFTASSAAAAKLTVQYDGGIKDAKYTTAGGILYVDSNSLFAQTTPGSNGQCLTSAGGGTPTWAGCGSGTSGGVWVLDSIHGDIYPLNNTLDVLVGGTSTASAKFAILNVAGGTPVASISAQNANNQALVLGSDETIQTVRNQNLTIGGAQTGNIILSPLNGGTGSTVTFNANTIALGGTNTVISNTGSNTLTLNSGSTGSTFFTNSNSFITNTGSLTIAGTFTLPNSITLTGAASQLQTSNGFMANANGSTGQKTAIDSSGNVLPGQDGSANLGASNAEWNNLFVKNIYLPISGGVGGFWQLNNSVLSPSNIYDDLAVGGTATGSGTPFQVFANPNGTAIAGTASTSGYLTFWGASNRVNLLNNSSLAFYNSVSGDTGITTSKPALYLANSGNVGIGTNNPVADLNIIDNNGNDTIRLTRASESWSLGPGTGTGTGKFGIFDNTQNATRMIIDTAGLVGIGTTSPLSLLEVYGGTQGGNAAVIFDQRGAITDDIFTASASGTTRFTIGNNGNLSDISSATTTTTASISAIASTTGNIFSIVPGNPQINNNGETLSSGNIINVASANHTYMTLTNQDLSIGGHKNNITLSNVNKVFVYDTSKDPDGGRWTNDERAQAASWYTGGPNGETRTPASSCIIGTNIRCGQQAFPRKAIIVIDNTKLYIFDAKDNSLWMQFTSGPHSMILNSSGTLTSIFALNGVIYVGMNNTGTSYTLSTVNFRTDSSIGYSLTTDCGSDPSHPISQRNSGFADTVCRPNHNQFIASGGTAAVYDVKAAIISGKQYWAAATSNTARGDVAMYNESDQTPVGVFGPNTKAANVWLTSTGNLYATIGDAASPANYAVKVKYGAQNSQANPFNTSILFDEFYVNRSGTSNYGAGTSDTNTFTSLAPTAGPASTSATFVPTSLYVTEGTSTVDGASDTIYLGAQGSSGSAMIIQAKRGQPNNGSIKYMTGSYISEEMVGDVRGMYPLDGNVGTGVTDVSVLGNHLTNGITGSKPTYNTSGVRDLAATLTANSYAYASGSGLLKAVTNPMSVSAWVHPTAVTGTNGVRNMWVSADLHTTSSMVSWGIGTKGNAGGVTPDIYCFANGSSNVEMNTLVRAANNTWHHVVLTSDTSGNLKCYVDGQLTATGTVSSAEVPDSFQIGHTQSQGTNFAAVTGDMNDVIVTATTLTNAEIAHMYQVGYRALQNHTANAIRGVNIAANTHQALATTDSNVQAIATSMQNGKLYIGTSGGISVIGLDSDTLTDLYSNNITTTDDTSVSWQANNNFNNSISVGQSFGNGMLLAFGSNNAGSGGIWMESNDTTLKDFFATNYNPFGGTLNQSNLNVDSVFQVTNQLSTRFDNLATDATSSAAIAAVFRVDQNGNFLFRSAVNSTTAMQFQDASANTVLNVDTNNDRVGIGTTAPAANLEIYTNNGQSVQDITNYSTSNLAPTLTFRRGEGTGAAPAAVTTDDVLGRVTFVGYNGSALSGTSALYGANATAAWSTTSNPTYLQLSTTSSGSTAVSERMRIDDQGRVAIGTTGNYGNATFTVNQTAANSFNNGDLMTASTSAGTTEMKLLTTGSLQARTFADLSNPAYFLQPSAVGTSMVVAGNVGIGTTSPVNKLDVNGSMAIGTYAGTNTATSNGLIVSGNVGIGTSNPSSSGQGTGSELVVENPQNVNWGVNILADSIATGNSDGVHIGFTKDNSGVFKSWAAGVMNGVGETGFSINEDGVGGFGNSRLYIKAGGNVGIGVTAPGAPLEIRSSNTYAGENGPLMITNAAVTTKKVSIGYDNSIDAGFISSLNSGVAWKNLVLQGGGGNVGIGNTGPGDNFAVGSDIRMGTSLFGGGYSELYLNGSSGSNYNLLSKAADPNLYINAPSSNSIRMRFGNVDRAVFGGSGQYPLDINSSVSTSFGGGFGYLSPGGACCFYGFGTGTVNVSLHTNNRAFFGEEIDIISDKRLKDLVGRLDPFGSLNVLRKLSPLLYTWKPTANKSGGVHTGFFAQEAEAIVPQSVSVMPSDGLPDAHILDYNTLFTYNVSATQGLALLFDQLATQSADLASQVSSLSHDLTLDESGLNIAPATDSAGFTIPHYYTVTDILGNPVTRISQFSQIIAGNIRAGFISAQEVATNSLAITTDNVSIAGKSLQQYILDVVNTAGIITNGGHIISPLAEINTIHTNIISPLSTTGNIAISLEDNTISVRNGAASTSAIVAQIDNIGNATFSGTLNPQNLAVNADATVSGTLYAGKIVADQIEGLAAKVGTLAAQNITNVTNIYFATPSSTIAATGSGNGQNIASNPSPQLPGGYANVASFSAYLAYVPQLSATTATFEQGLMSLGPTSLADTTITGQLSIGGQLILADTSINVLGGDLQLQPLRQGGVQIAGGQVKIDQDGNLTVNGKAVFTNTVVAKVISPLPNQDLTVQLGDTQTPNTDSHFTISNASGSAVFAVNQIGDFIASGTATIAKLNLGLAQPAFALSDTEVTATGSAGTASINPYQKELTIDNPLVTDKSLIYITPVGNTSEILVLLRQVPGASFTVGIPLPNATETKFNWLIIN